MDNWTMFRCSVFYELGMECDTDQERLELWQAIMEYGLFWKEPPKKFKRDFVNIKFILGRNREISGKRSEAWKLWWAPEGNSNAVKNWKNDIKQAKQAKQAKTSKTSESDSYSISILSSSKKEEKNRRKEEMLEAFRKDERLTPYMNEEDVVRWLEYKEWRKEPYKDAKSFIKTLIGVKNDIASYWGMPKSDRNRRNRFSYMVDRIIEGNWSWLERYDSFEQKYQNSKDDLYPNPKQNE